MNLRRVIPNDCRFILDANVKSQKAKEGNLPGGIAGPGDSERFSDMMRVDQADQQDDDKDKDDNGDTQNIL